MKFRCTLPRNTIFGGNRVNGVYIEDTHNVMIDHVSVAFCSDALLRLRYHSNVTVQHSALTHPRGRASGDYVNAIYLRADSTAGSTGHTTVMLLKLFFSSCCSPLSLLVCLLFSSIAIY